MSGRRGRTITILGVAILSLAAAPAGGRAADRRDPLAAEQAVVAPLLATVDSLLALGETEAAFARAQRLQRRHGRSVIYGWQIQERLGLSLLRMGRAEEAVPHLEAAIGLAPEAPSPHQNLGAALMALGRRGRALTEFEEALGLAPENWRLHLDFGQNLLVLGLRAQALERLEEADRLCGGCPEAARALAMLHLAAGDHERAIPHLERLLAAEGSPRVRRLLADAALQGGRPERVQQLLAPLWPGELNREEVALLLAADRATGESARARDMARHPEIWTGLADAALWGQAGMLCLEEGLDAEGLAAFDRAIALDPLNAVFRNNRVVLLTRLGREEEARREWDRVLELAPGLGDAGG